MPESIGQRILSEGTTEKNSMLVKASSMGKLHSSCREPHAFLKGTSQTSFLFLFLSPSISSSSTHSLPFFHHDICLGHISNPLSHRINPV